ncbi:MAG: FG-GAP repeat protein [Rhodanobacteraceae bacterium]
MTNISFYPKRCAVALLAVCSAWSAGAACPPDVFAGADDFRLADHDTAYVFDQFGHAMATNGRAMAVGVPNHNFAAVHFGEVYLFRRVGAPDQWQFLKRLDEPGFAESNDLFGDVVAMDGDTLVVGARDAGDTGPNDAGAVYTFFRNLGGSDNWGHSQTLYAQETDGFAEFGSTIGMRGNVMIIGDPRATVSGSMQAGKAVIYRRASPSASWVEVTSLVSPAIGSGEADYAAHVAIDGDTAVVSDHGLDNGSGPTGHVYVYERNQGGADQWGLVRDIGPTASNAGDSDFGTALSIWEDRLAVSTGDSEGGRIYIFERDQGGGSNWGKVTDMQPPASELHAGNGFGRTLHLHSHEVIVGAPGAAGIEGSTGAIFVFHQLEGGVDNWGFVQKFFSQSNNYRSTFGDALDWSAGFAAVGDPTSNDPSFADNAKVGHAYMFFDDTIMCSPFD